MKRMEKRSYDTFAEWSSAWDELIKDGWKCAMCMTSTITEPVKRIIEKNEFGGIRIREEEHGTIGLFLRPEEMAKLDVILAENKAKRNV